MKSALSFFLKEDNIDVIINQWWPHKLVHNTQKHLMGGGVIACHHANMPALSVPENPDTLVKKIFYGLLGKFGAWLKRFLRGKNVLRYSDKWIFLSKGYAETAKQIFGSKIFPSRRADKIDFIHNPIKLVNAAAPVNIEKKDKIILSVGRINPGKRINLQLDAWRKLKLRNCTSG